MADGIKHTRAMAICLVCIAYTSTTSHAEIFHFKDGRVIEGEIVGQRDVQEENRAPKTVYSVKVGAGSYLQIHESQLQRNGIKGLSQTEQEYQALLRQSPPQTAEEHVQIAGKYLRSLPEIARAHYEAAVELDPENGVARAGAGYKKDADGRWQRVEEIMGEQRGKVFYGGRWRFPEDVLIQQAREKADAEMAPLTKKINTWNTAASFGRSEKMRADAIEKLRQVQDPREAALLADNFLDKRRTPPVDIRLLYVNILSRFDDAGFAISALTQASLYDPEPRVRTASLDALRNMRARQAVPTFISYLGDSDNVIVNRAAEGLAQFDPPEATIPLIEALNTEHIEDNSGGAGMNVNMQGGLSFGGGSKKTKVTRQNQSVLATLSEITGQNFGYNEDQWLAWYASLHAAPVTDLRRDP